MEHLLEVADIKVLWRILGHLLYLHHILMSVDTALFRIRLFMVVISVKLLLPTFSQSVDTQLVLDIWAVYVHITCECMRVYVNERSAGSTDQ